MIYDNKLMELLNSKHELRFKKMLESYMPFIYKLVLNELSINHSKEAIEEYLRDIFWEVLNYKNEIESQTSFIKVLLSTIGKRKIIDMYRKNNEQIHMEDVSLDLHILSENVVRSILLKDSNSQLIDVKNSLNESDGEIITRKYYLNQSIKDISMKSGLKVSSYA